MGLPIKGTPFPVNHDMFWGLQVPKSGSILLEVEILHNIGNFLHTVNGFNRGF